MKIRPYVDDDLPQLQAALAGWTQATGSCGYCHVGYLPYMIYETLRGRRPVGEMVHLWEDSERMVGMAINGLFDTSFLVLTSPAYRETDGEIEMLQVAYETTRRHLTAIQGDDTPVSTDVYNCDTIRMELLARLAFSQYRVWDHITERSLSEPIPDAHLPDGFTLRCATMDDYVQLALVRNDAFDDNWTPELFRDEVMHKPGYQPEWEIVVVAPDGQIAASTVMRLDEVNQVGLFEPVGTRRAFQRRGLARAMMLYGLCDMKRLGMERARVEYDATNEAARELYRSLGFQKTYETLGYQRV